MGVRLAGAGLQVRAACPVRAPSAAAPAPRCPQRAAASRWPCALRRPSRLRTAVSCNSSVSGCGARMPKSVITARGPPPRRRCAPLAVAAAETCARAEIQSFDEAARRRLQHRRRSARVRGNLGRAARARQARGRRAVIADDGAVEVAETVDLRGAEKADIDAPALQVVAEHFGHGTTQARRLASSPSPIDSGSTSGSCRSCRTRRSARCPGACVRRARLQAALGKPMPTKQTHRSRSMRAAAMVIISSRCTQVLMPPSARGCARNSAWSCFEHVPLHPREETSRGRARSRPSAGRRRCRARSSHARTRDTRRPGNARRGDDPVRQHDAVHRRRQRRRRSPRP